MKMEIMTNSGKNVKLGIGICMDINPYEFKSPFEDFEFSNFCFKNDSDAVIFLTNWTEAEEDQNNNENDYSTINYWYTRCTPLFKSKKPVYFLAADRTGREKDSKNKLTCFVGNSCIIKIGKGKDSGLISRLNKTETGVIYDSLSI